MYVFGRPPNPCAVSYESVLSQAPQARAADLDAAPRIRRILITGGAGFVGSNLVDSLLMAGHSVRVLDNLSTGLDEFLRDARTNPHFEMVHCDLVDEDTRLAELVSGAEAVVHLAANADVRHGWSEPRRDMLQNGIATHNVLEAMRKSGVQRIVFASTGSVYGEAKVVPTPEDCPFPLQTSLYGASKLAAEALISAYVEGSGFRGTIFRFVSNLGPRYTHGHVIDFVRQLLDDPTRVRVLGDGTQRKSYLHVADTCKAVIASLGSDERMGVYNLGTDGYCTVADSLSWICERMEVRPAVEYQGGDRGWVGDNPFIYLDTTRIRATGWMPSFGIREAVEDTVDYLLANRWILEQHKVRA